MASATIEASASLVQSETRTFTETEHKVKKKKSTRRHKEEGTVSVSKSSEKLYKKMKSSMEGDSNPLCEKCSRPVYAMERVKAERRVWHKECFRCAQCQKQLTVETYESDHTTLYCRPHFKQLFEPKPVDNEDQTDAPPKKHQLIICESNPVELPPDVVRASDKPDLGLEELSNLDVKSRFEVFEKKSKPEAEVAPPETRVAREKSAVLLSKLAKFKAKGMDVGVADEYLNGVPLEPSSSEHEDEDDDDSVLKNSYKHTATKEQPVSLCNMSEIVGKFEAGEKEFAERRKERKQEIQNIRSRLFMGKQAKIKEMYEQSVMQSEQSITSADKIARELELDSEKARAIKQRFETGEVFNDENVPPKNREIDDPSLFNEGIGKKSRSIFLELDANAAAAPPAHLTPTPPPPRRKEIPFIPQDVVRASDSTPEVAVDTSDISDRFKFFETYTPKEVKKEFRMTPPRETQRPKSPSPEVYRDPGVVSAASPATDALPTAHTATKMINVFKHMENNVRKQDEGPKPLKRFTPPPEGAYTRDSESESETDSESEGERIRRNSQDIRARDSALIQAQQLARTTSFREKFERWPQNETERSPSTIVIERDNNNDEEDGESQLETAKSLRAKFESMTVQQSTVNKSIPKVNRFV